LAAKGEDINEALQQTRTNGHEKFGVALSLEQELTDALGAFARWSWNNGRNEDWGFTDADSSAAAGMSLKGERWGRKDDTVGIGTAINAITQAHRQFLANGGDTLLLGDGALNYGHEIDLETYYAAKLMEFLTLTGDYQFIVNPGYNQDRGPVHVFGARLHAEF
jgi:high affinity Mn2+ porin